MTELDSVELGEVKRDENGLRQRQHLSVERVVFNQPELNEDYEGGPRVLKTPGERWQLFRKKNELTPGCFGRFMLSYLPFIDIMKKYSFKRDIVPDVIAGLTVGIMQIPQGMAYAVLASMDAVYGLYMSFFPIIIYFFFGTSRHLSFGTFAVISLMVGSAVDRLCGEEVEVDGVRTGNFTDPECAIEVASALTFTGGLMQMGMSFLHLGFVVIYLSEPMTRGFTTGCSIHVFTSQLKSIFGTYRDLILAMPLTNPAAVIASVLSGGILWVVKEYANPPVKKRFRAPIPIDLVIVILGTVISHYANFESKYGLEVIGEVPTGLPAPTMPPVKWFSTTAVDAFVIGIVAYAISISMAQNFAEKNGYSVDANQELLAHGITNFVCSNFKCYMMSVSLSRSLVQETLGGVTQIAGLVAALLMLIVLLALASLFEALPSCVLAAIIIVALKGMFLQMKDIPKYWRISKTDLSVWMVTFLAVIILDIDLGLLVGVCWSFITVIGRTQRPYVCDMGRIGDTDMYGDKRSFDKASDIPGVKIVRFESSVYFANRDYFIDRVFLKARCQPKVLGAAMKKAYKKRSKAIKKGKADNMEVNIPEIEAMHPVPCAPIHHVILDCSTIGFLDSMGVAGIGTIIKEYKEVDVEVFLAATKPSIRELLEESGAHENIPRSRLFPTIHDAVVASLEGKPEQKLFLNIEAAESSPPSYSNHRMSQDLSPEEEEASVTNEPDIPGVVVSVVNGVVNQSFTPDEEEELPQDKNSTDIISTEL